MTNDIAHTPTKMYLPAKVLLEEGVIDRVGLEVSAMNLGWRALLIYEDTRVFDAVSSLASSLNRVGMRYVCCRVSGNGRGVPTLSKVWEVVKLALDERCDFVIGLGSRATINLAKAVAAVMGGSDLEDLGEKARIEGAAPLVVVPIIPSSGSEFSGSLELFDEDRGVMLHYLSHSLYPRLVLVDPLLAEYLEFERLTLSIPEILVNALEAYTSRECSRFVELVVEEATRALLRVEAQTLKLPVNSGVVRELCWAGLCAGVAVGLAGGGACSALARTISAMYGVHYERAISALLACWLYMVSPEVESRLEQLARATGVVPPSSAELITRLLSLLRGLNLPITLLDLGVVRVRELDLVVEHAWTYGHYDMERGVKPLDKLAVKRALRLSAEGLLLDAGRSLGVWDANSE